MGRKCLILLILGGCHLAGAEAPLATDEGPKFIIHTPDLREAFQYLLAESPAFRESLSTVEPNRSVIIADMEDLPAGLTPNEEILPDQIALTLPLPGESGFDRGALIVFSTAGHIRSSREARYPERLIHRDLAIVLAHEIYGHLIPAWEDVFCGDTSHGAGIPGCAIVRENLIRAELGLPDRTGHTSTDLPLLCPSLQCPSSEP